MSKKHIVAIIGGACAGSEAANQLTSQGVEVVVFEQNPLPYGKIEDGLPRWHAKLQNKEEEKIDEKLSKESVHFVPSCKLGQDVQIQELLDLGFSCVVLANGAWRDRPMNVEGVDMAKDNSFCYQNPFIYWFNHYHEKSYQGITYPVKEGAVIVGGGLASIDVIKVCQLETAYTRLKERGIETDVIALEHKGIHKILKEHGLTYEDLNIKPAKLYYRKRVCDMPLADMPPGCDEKKKAKVQSVREKIIKVAQQKYFFEMCPLRVIKKLHTENGAVTGVTFLKTQFDGSKLTTTEEEDFVETTFVVSSIGSIPEPVTGVSMSGETYDIFDYVTGKLKGFESVFGIGNAVTGKGNIKVSYKHAKYMGKFIADSLGEDALDEETTYKNQEEQVIDNLKNIFNHLRSLEATSEQKRENVISHVKKLQEKAGYSDYHKWRESILNAR